MREEVERREDAVIRQMKASELVFAKEQELTLKSQQIDQLRRDLDDHRVCLEIREKELRKLERKTERELDRAIKA